MASPTWNLGFDARLAGPRHAGIGRYSEELLKRLIPLSQRASQRIQWHVFVPADHELTWLSRWQKEKVVTVHVTDVPHYSLAEQTRWWWELHQVQLDILHVPHFNAPLAYRRPLVVTIHDLLWHQERDARATTLPASLHWIKHRAYQLVSGQAIRHASRVFVPTKWVAKDVQRLTGRSKGIVVTAEGIPSAFRSAQLASGPRRNDPYVVYTGSLYPHKNLTVVLKALRQLPDMKLKVIGTRTVFLDRMRQQAERMGVAPQIEWCGRLTDQEVIDVYQRAVALIQPSRAEGFGLTGLEALAVGCPIIVSDIPVFHEVYQEHAAYFPSYDGVSLAHHIEKLALRGPSQSQRSEWQRFARGYTWDQTAEQTWAGYQSVLDELKTPTSSVRV